VPGLTFENGYIETSFLRLIVITAPWQEEDVRIDITSKRWDIASGVALEATHNRVKFRMAYRL
jgi:hypothetical protein